MSIKDDILRDDKPGLLECLKELQDESELCAFFANVRNSSRELCLNK